MLQRISTLGFEGWFLIICSSIFLTLIGNLLFRSQIETIHKRIENMNVFSSGTDEEKNMQLPLYKRTLNMLEESIKRYLEQNMKKGKLAPLKLKLQQADIKIEPIQHWTKKIMYAMGMSGLGLAGGYLLHYSILILALVGALLGFYLPELDLNERIKKRQFKIKNELPDFLDLLASTAPSAKNLEDAIAKVCIRSEGIVSNEFQQVLNEINSGRRTRDALKDMSMRCGILEIDTLMAQINQAEAFGTGVEKTLLVQAEKMRKLKKLLAEIKARKASVMLLLPSLFLLITCLIMIAGPSIVAIFQAGNMMG